MRANNWESTGFRESLHKYNPYWKYKRKNYVLMLLQLQIKAAIHHNKVINTALHNNDLRNKDGESHANLQRLKQEQSTH